MCGICGIIARNAAGVDQSRLLKMRDTMVHRGPDGAGYYSDRVSQVGLGHRRLKIIDLSDAAAQPMTNEDGSIWITYNGEIYNYQVLVRTLQARGHEFASHSDTEVIIHAYEEWGIECLTRFNGMFAFALWDESKRLLFCARDRLGIKPFYYSVGSAEFIFASELKAICQASPGLRSPNHEAIYDFLTLMQLDHNEGTFLAGVKQLPSGHYILLDVDKWMLFKPTSYWSLSPQCAAETLDYSSPIETFRDLLFDSVRLQLRSDVPVGTFLSGGLDSSSLVAIISKLSSQPMRSFSVAYEQTGYDERVYLDAVINSYPVVPTRTYPNVEKLHADLSRFVWAQDTPPAGPGPFSEWCVAELARGSVKVLLNGQGPDEMLGGYQSCLPAYMRSLRDDIATGVEPRGWSALIHDARALSHLNSTSFMTSAGYYLVSAMLPSARLQSMLDATRRRVRERWLKRDFLNTVRRTSPVNDMSVRRVNALDSMLHSWVLRNPLPALLHYADRNSMAFSLEARVPYLDHRLVEYAAGLPLRFKLAPPFTKQVLRQAMDGYLIDEVRMRRTKLGFATPVGEWMRQRPTILMDVLTDTALKTRNIVDPDRVRSMMHRHLAGNHDFGWDLWRLLVLELWFQSMIDDQPIVP